MASLARGNPARWWKGRSCGAASRAPKSMFISPFRRWLSGLALCTLLLFLGGLWYLTNPARISRLSETLLSRVLGGNVKVRSGHLSFSGTLLLSGVEVRTADTESTPASDIPIFTAEQIEARFDWFSLFSGQLSATQLVATTPVFRPIEDHETGHWNYESLNPGLGGGQSRTPSAAKGLTLPVVVVRDAHVRWGEVRQGRVMETAETIIDGSLTPDAALPTTYHLQFSQMAPALANATQSPPEMGMFLRGTWDSAANTFNASTDNVAMTDTLRNGLPRQAREWCEEHHLAGRLSQLNLTFNPHDGLGMSLAFDGVSMMWMVEPEQGIAVGDERPAYPLDVRDVRGKISFTLSRPSNPKDPNPAVQQTMHIEDLTGEALGYRFVVDDCIVQGTSFNAPFDLKLRFPNAVLGEHYPPLFMAFMTSQDLLQRVAPHGKMDIAIRMRRLEKAAPMQVDGAIDCHDVTMRFAHFPYPMDHLNGRITFTQQSCTFHDVVGKCDVNDVKIDGTTGTVWTNRVIDFTIISENAWLDDRLAACMPQKFKDIWDSFAVSGHGKLVCRVTRSNALFDQPKFVVDVDVDQGGGYIRSVPYAFTGAQGHLHFEADETRVEHLTARTGADGSGRIELNGVVHHPSGDVTHLQPELNVTADVPLDDRLLHALPEEWTAKLREYALGGRVSFDGSLKRSEDEEPTILATGTVGWREGTLKGPIGGQNVSLSGATAKVQVSPTALDVQAFSAALELPGAEKVNVTVAGKLETPAMAGSLQVTAAGKELTLPAAAPAWFPKAFAENWVAYAPGGKFDLDARTTLRINMPAETAPQAVLRVNDTIAIATYGGSLTLHDASLKNAAWPDALTKLNGTVEVVPGKINMNGMSAEMGGVAVQWQGLLKPETGWVNLSVDATARGLPEKWLKYLPDAVKDHLDLKQEGTQVALHLDSLTRPDGVKPWVYEGRLEATKLGILGAMPMLLESATTSGKGTWDPGTEGAFTFSGALDSKNITISDHILETLKANLEVAGERHQISVTEMNGKVAAGTLQGDIQIRTAGGPATAPSATTAPGTMPAEGGYVANLVLSDAELSRLLLPSKATDEERRKVGSGRVTASLSLQETFGPQADRTGRGDLEVADANIYDVPLSMGLMQIVTLRLPVAHSFQHATMSYYLRNNEITFERILLESPGVNLAGAGSVGISDRTLNLNFITATPHMMIPILSAVQSELLEVTVTGTVSNPKVTPVPLSPVANVLRALLPQQARADH